jgi:hypothetical protein
VEVCPNGQVFVNDVLVAEVTIARFGGDGPTVVTRDDLARQISLHRISDIVSQRLDELVDFLERGRPKSADGSQISVAVEERADFGAALIAGLVGEPGELTGRSAYRNGHRAGVTLRALRDHLLAEGGSHQ